MGHGEIKAYYISIPIIISPKTYFKQCLISFLYTANTKYSIGSTTIPEMEVEPWKRLEVIAHLKRDEDIVWTYVIHKINKR